MNSTQQAIDEMLPMISEFLEFLGMSEKGETNLIKSLDPFSAWVSEQEVNHDNYGYLVSRVAAFFCQYYVQKCGASIKEVNNTIQLTLPLGEEASQSIDPYFFASAVAKKQMTLIQAIDANVS